MPRLASWSEILSLPGEPRVHSSKCPNSKATPVLKCLDLFLPKYERKLEFHIGPEDARWGAELNGVTSGPSSSDGSQLILPGWNPCGSGLGVGQVSSAGQLKRKWTRRGSF